MKKIAMAAGLVFLCSAAPAKIEATPSVSVPPHQSARQAGGRFSGELTAGDTLHTHIWEAFHFQPPSLDIAEKVVNQIKAAGIDGIAITDHHNKDWAFEFRELVERHYP